MFLKCFFNSHIDVLYNYEPGWMQVHHVLVHLYFFSAGHFNDGNLRHGSLQGRRVACLLASIRSLYVRYSLRHSWRFYVNLLTTGHDRHCRLRGTNKRTTHHATRETASTDTDRPPSSWHSERSNFQRISSTKRMKGENEYGNKCKVQ